jgi:hypothetical protein
MVEGAKTESQAEAEIGYYIFDLRSVTTSEMHGQLCSQEFPTRILALVNMDSWRSSALFSWT